MALVCYNYFIMNTTAKQINRILSNCKAAKHARKDKKASRAKQKQSFSRNEYI